MGKFLRSSWPVFIAVVIVVATACNHSSVPDRENNNSTNDSRQVPFHDVEGSPLMTSAAESGERQPASGAVDLPFTMASEGSLPAGTMLTVRLDKTLSSTTADMAMAKDDPAKPGSKSSFAATLEEPIVFNGNTIVAAGATVAGHVESARVSMRRNHSYVRLILTSIRIDGRDLPLQTASLFARATPEKATSRIDTAFSPVDNQVIQIQKGRLLTFRLDAPVSLPAISAARIGNTSGSGSD